MRDPYEVPVLSMLPGERNWTDAPEVLILDQDGFRYRGMRLPISVTTADVHAAAYYPRHNLLETVDPHCRVALYARASGAFRKVASWEPSEPDRDRATLVRFSVLPGLLWIEYRGAYDKETEQITIHPYEVGLGLHTWCRHIAAVTAGQSYGRSFFAVYTVYGYALKVHFPEGLEQTLNLPRPLAWRASDDRVTIDREAGTVVSVLGGWAFFDVSGRYVGLCNYGPAGSHMNRAANGNQFSFSGQTLSDADSQYRYRCDFSARRLVLVGKDKAAPNWQPGGGWVSDGEIRR